MQYNIDNFCLVNYAANSRISKKMPVEKSIQNWLIIIIMIICDCA